MTLLTRDAILAAQDLPFEDLAIPEWGGTVRIRTLTGTERDQFEASCAASAGPDGKRNYDNIRARLVSLTAIGESGERLFAFEDAQALGGKSAKALDACFDVATRLNGMGTEAVKALGKT